MKVAITGASGFVGTRVRSRFTSHVVIDRDLSVSEIEQRLRGVDAVINLAGAPIIKRWSRSYKDVLYQSRISTTGRLAEALNRTDRNIHLVSASATGIYPEHMACDETCTETANDFLGKLARDWEQQAMLYRGPVSIMRLGVVLGPEGGALSKMLPVFRLGLGGPVGNGGMITSWIDIEDLLRAFEFVIRLGLTGVFNAVAPNPVSNAEFTKALANVLRRPALLPVPETVLRLIYGEAASVLTGSWEVYPGHLLKAGFRFHYPEIQASLRHLLTN